MHIEDLVIDLSLKCKLNRYDSQIVNSFTGQIFGGLGFTEKQSLLAVKLLKRYSTNLSQSLSKDILPFLDNPTYRFPIRKVSQEKRISIVSHTTWDKAIQVQFPYDQEKISQIRNFKSDHSLIIWNAEKKAWLFSLTEQNILFLLKFVENDHFELCEEFVEYQNQVKNIIDNMEKYIPMLTIENNEPKYKNISKFVPDLTSKDIISALFEAKKVGIFTWDDPTTSCVNSMGLEPYVKEFLTNEKCTSLDIDSGKTPIDCLSVIIQYANPTLFVIPGGSELENLKKIYNFLIGLGYRSDQMSVMFRLPNNEGRQFNEFVKNCGLNNPITENTKFVFVSVKLPKPILKSNIKFNSVVCLGKSHVHYTMREFFRNRENVIYYCEPNRQKEFNFVIL